jgi:hypothetical protein
MRLLRKEKKMTEEFYIGQVFENEYPPEAAIWCNENNAFIDVVDGVYTILEVPAPTPEEIKEERIRELQQYLNDTDWYVARYSETGVEIPEEVKQKRKEAREEISNLRG